MDYNALKGRKIIRFALIFVSVVPYAIFATQALYGTRTGHTIGPQF